MQAATEPASSPEAPLPFDWPLATEAEQLLRQHINVFLDRNSFARQLADRMRDETGTDFFEWVDHFVLPPGEQDALSLAGFVRDPNAETPNGEAVSEYPRATLPRVLLRPGPAVIALRPEFVADFIASHNLSGRPEGEPCSRYRRIVVAAENGTQLEAVERRAYRGFVPAPLAPSELRNLVKARELWRTRPRSFAEDAEGFQTANVILDRILRLVGRDLACQFFFEAERAYWESRNRAARIQKHRQDRLGLGWGNHDHHTFRCSRRHFVDLVEFLLKLGFAKRERYYAGAEAGWGAQVSEQPVTGIVVFADVDLLPEETQVDFSTQQLPPAPRLGTVGLWVGLHGESFLEAGMHHLEARFEFDLLRDQLKDSGVSTMNPFSDFPFLRQAFTEGERWPVRRVRAQRLLSEGLITRDQFDRFIREGALGSHLENLQRHGGFKGFNQTAVSVVITATDPRRNHFSPAPPAA
ncbi:MAG TPA: hypothetical protein P5205_16330 [Candidatus Paceibacterota bacterium]|nr:hypothetical protein [Verrucomicrobiota bacterium]HSA11929.1 hypothetical protein [Candidatus Paceibacterota bacterium]